MDKRRGPAPGWVALTLAIGLATALNLFVLAIVYDALTNAQKAGVSENAVQILTGWGGGIIGIIGGYVGYVAGEERTRKGDRRMTDQEKGSNAQMTDEQRAELQRRAELEQAAIVEEERKTAAEPDTGDG